MKTEIKAGTQLTIWACLASATLILMVGETIFAGLIALGLLALALFLYRKSTGHWFEWKGWVDAAWLFFLISAAWAVWAAFDRDLAFLQFVRLLTAAVLFYFIANTARGFRQILVIAFIGFVSIFAIGWLIEFLLGLSGRDFVIPILRDAFVDHNVRAGVLAMTLPLSIAFALHTIRAKDIGLASIMALATLLQMAALVAMRSDGAVVGVVSVAGLVLLYAIQRRWLSGKRWLQELYWVGIAIVVGITINFVLQAGVSNAVAEQLPGLQDEVASRSQIWLQGLDLVDDYAFTGMGLQSFSLVHSTYRLLIHVPYQPHSHNVYLQVWLEQGIVGGFAVVLFCFAALTLVWEGFTNKTEDWIAWAAFLGLVTVAVHGLADVIFYVHPTAPLLGFVAGLAWHLQGDRKSSPVRSIVLPGVVFATALLLAFVFLNRQMLGSVYANWGALLQTQNDLARYDPDHFDALTLDEIRQTSDLSAIQAAYDKALFYDPNNEIALQRLGMLALSLGDYVSASDLLGKAWEQGSNDEVTELLYSDVLIAEGKPDQVPKDLVNQPFALDRLAGQAWYRYYLGGDYERSVNVWEAILALSPDFPDAQARLQEAQIQLNQPE